MILFCISTAQAAALPAWILRGRPVDTPPLSIPGFSDIDANLKEKGTVRVIVRITAPVDQQGGFVAEGTLKDKAAIDSQRAALTRRQNAILSRISPSHAVAAKKFHFIPYMALEVNQAEFEALTSSLEINHIEQDTPVPPALSDSVPLIGGVNGSFSGYTGSGQSVAILDTGVDKTHNFLTGKVVAEACFSTTSVPYKSTAVCSPWGSTAPGSGLNCSDTYVGCSHGTHVAGIAAGSGETFSGVAKDASLIAIQVFSGFPASECNGSPCVMSWNSDQIAGLEHVYDLRSIYSIASVNMSLGGGKFTTYCDGESPAETAAIEALRSVGIATAIASGNDEYLDSISFPGCISSAVSVGATTKSDGVAWFSNSASFLNLLAPGYTINSSVPGGTFRPLSGTSMATPHVAGAWAGMKSARPAAGVSQVLSALTSTGKPIIDSRNAIIKPRIRLAAAVRQLLHLPLNGDFDGDGKADIAVWQPGDGGWIINPSSGINPYTVGYGAIGDKLVAGDYDADGKCDVAVWRPSIGTWFITNSNAGSQTVTTYGISTDIPVPGDYDGDGKTDIAVWRPASGIWFITNSNGGTQTIKIYGISTDTAVPGDYDGDGKTDVAIWRPSTGTWFISNSSNGSQTIRAYGESSDTPVPADYDGDGRIDIAVWRPASGIWFIRNSNDGSQTIKAYGASDDIPVPGDYDGDGKIDIAVWRPSNAVWYIVNSASGSQSLLEWGESTDQPVKTGQPVQ